MENLKNYSFMVQRFYPGALIRDMGYDIKECTHEELDVLFLDERKLDNDFWGHGDTEFENNLKNIIKMYPLVFCEPKAVQRLQQLCMLYDLRSVPEETLKKYPGFSRHNSYEEVSKYIIFPSKDFYNSSKLSTTLPSDRVIVDETVMQKIDDIWNKNKSKISAPCDLINTGMLPAPDIEIQINKAIYRIRIDETVNEYGTEITFEGRRRHVGFIMLHSSETNKDTAIEISEDISGLICMEKAVFLNPKEKMIPVDYFELCQMVSNIMRIWYGIQLLMLHPRIKYIFEHPKMQTFFNVYKKVKKGKITYSIKTIRITNNMLEYEVNDPSGQHHVYQCSLWWVIGHKRYKKERTEWVKGYWKGPLRELGKPENYEVREKILKGYF